MPLAHRSSDQIAPTEPDLRANQMEGITIMFAKNIKLAAAVALGMFNAVPVMADSEFSLTFADFAANSGPRADVLSWWADELNKRTEGRVEIEFFWSGSLLKTKDILKGVSNGVADMGTVIATITPAELPLFTYGSFPFNEVDSWIGVNAWWELHKTDPHLLAEMEENNIKMLLQNVSGPNQLVCREEPLDTTEKLKGAQIRVPGQLQDFMTEIGANVVNISTGDLYQAIDRGIVDCTQFGMPFIKSYKLYEVAKALVIANFSNSYQYGTAINLDTWNSLPEDIQAIMTELSEEYTARIAESIVKQIQSVEAELRAGIDGYKMNIVEVDPEEYATWSQFTTTAMPGFRERSGKSDEVLDEFLAHHDELVAKYRAEFEANGYPWETN